MHEQVVQAVELLKEKIKKETKTVNENDTVVYVYLFNAQGLVLESWVKMLHPAVFYEYSVNRPIYLDKAHVKILISHKTTRSQHAYLSVAIKKTDILQGEEKDAYGNTVIKVREGSLLAERMVSFTHNETDYVLNKDRLVVKKPT